MDSAACLRAAASGPHPSSSIRSSSDHRTSSLSSKQVEGHTHTAPQLAAAPVELQPLPPADLHESDRVADTISASSGVMNENAGTSGHGAEQTRR